MIDSAWFDGWLTPIEEAKGFVTPFVRADIPIHREQAPDVRFFH